jgi:uncharacterized protein YjeT (DUF2065 family)
MSQRAPGTRKSQGLILMAVGVVLMLLFTALSLTDVTTTIARANNVLLIAGVVTLAAGAALYSLARIRTRPQRAIESDHE